MDTKFPIFILIALILTIAVYSSSVNFVSAAIYVQGCVRYGDNYSECTITEKPGVKSDWKCVYDSSTNNWSCVKAKTGSGTPNQLPGSETLNKMTDSQIPLGLRNALDSAVQKSNSPIPPECPKTGPIPPDCTMKPPLK